MLMWIPTCCRPGPVHSRATSRHAPCDVTLGGRLLIRAACGITPAVLDQQGRAGASDVSPTTQETTLFFSCVKTEFKSNFPIAVIFWNNYQQTLTNSSCSWWSYQPLWQITVLLFIRYNSNGLQLSVVWLRVWGDFITESDRIRLDSIHFSEGLKAAQDINMTTRVKYICFRATLYTMSFIIIRISTVTKITEVKQHFTTLKRARGHMKRLQQISNQLCVFQDFVLKPYHFSSLQLSILTWFNLLYNSYIVPTYEKMPSHWQTATDQQC